VDYLFLYINDIYEASKLPNIILFANVTRLFYSARNSVDTVSQLSLSVNTTHVIMSANKKQRILLVNIIIIHNLDKHGYTSVFCHRLNIPKRFNYIRL